MILFLLSFDPPFFLAPWLGLYRLLAFEFSSKCCHILCSNSSLAYPEHFLHHIGTSSCLSILLTKSWPPKCRLHHFSKLFDKNSVLCIFPPSSKIHSLFHISCTDTYLFPQAPLRSMLHIIGFLFHENTLFLRLWPELFTVFPLLYQAVEAGRILQCCIHLLSFLLQCFLLSLVPKILRPALLLLLPTLQPSRCLR